MLGYLFSFKGGSASANVPAVSGIANRRHFSIVMPERGHTDAALVYPSTWLRMGLAGYRVLYRTMD